MTVVFAPSRRLGWVLLMLSLTRASAAQAADLSWKGFDWSITDGGMAGVADGAAANVTVDANDWLHLKISKNGSTWTASELFTTQKLGFGTYQWQIEGPIDTFDKNNVLGLFPYGPAAGIGGDGTNEIDIEFSRWGIANAPNADFTDYPASGKVIGETTFTFSLGGSTSATARFIWNDTSIESSVLKGHQAMNSEAGLLKKWKYAPANANVNIPQQALPLGINLWCFDAPPSDGQNVEIVIRDFQFVKEGDPLPSGGGTGSGGTANGGSANGGSANAGAANAGAGTGGPGNGGAATGGATTGGASGTPGGGTLAGNSGDAPANGGAPVSIAGAATGGISRAGSNTASAGRTPTAGSDNATAGTGEADGASSEASCGCKALGAKPAAGAFPAVIALALLFLRRRGASRTP